MDDVSAWQHRPLDDVYPVVFLDALVLKIRDGGSVQRRACYLALAIAMDGERDVLGMWFQETEGAKFWMQVLTRAQTPRRPRHPDLLRRRSQRVPRGDRGGVPADHGADVHRASDPPQPEYVPRRAIRRRSTKDLKPIYTAIDADHARAERSSASRRNGAQQLPVVTGVARSWEYVIPFLAFPPRSAGSIYTTDESVKCGGLGFGGFLGDGSVAAGAGRAADRRRSRAVSAGGSDQDAAGSGRGRAIGAWRRRLRPGVSWR